MTVPRKFLLILLIVLLPVWSEGKAESSTTAPNRRLLHPERILQPFQEGRSTSRVVVNLVDPEPMTARRRGAPGFMKKRRQEIHTRQDAVLGGLIQGKYDLRHRFENLSSFSADVTPEALKTLEANPLVESIEPVYILKPHLAQGISLMNAAAVRTIFSGQGVAIAICDTGIDYTHPALGGGGFPNNKVIGGYDVADNDTDPMPSTQAHGTACAGIAAGDVIFVGDYIGGVADSAKLYALKITSGTSDSAGSDDIAAAWDWCVTHQNDDPDNPILVISTSFGGERYFSTCDGYSNVVTAAADNAVAAGITVLVSSGNDGYCDSISWPACVSSVISVGAVYDDSLGTFGFCIDDGSCASEGGGFTCLPGEMPVSQTTGGDVVAVYSNTASFLDILAPSHDAYTTDIVGSGGYSTNDYDPEFGGTSAACPYAAGAVACIQSAAKATMGDYLSPDDIRLLLTTTGDPVTDSKIAITKPRVNLGSAIEALGGLPPTALGSEVPVPLDTTVSITLEAIDEGLPEIPGQLSYTITSLPTHGILTEPNGFVIHSVPYTLPNYQNQVLYTPRPGCAVAAALTFYADDGGAAPEGGQSNEATVFLQPVAMNTIYTAAMDTDPGWTLNRGWEWGVPAGSGGANGNPDPVSGYTGSSVIGYNLSGDYGWLWGTRWARTPAIDCSNRTAVTLTFYRWLNVEEPAYDHASIQVSNNGSNWITFWENQTEITDSSWNLQEFDISAVADNQSTVYIRWGMGQTDRLFNYSGWNIDDVEVSGLSPAAVTPQPGDFEPDCDVDFDDLTLLIAYWLAYCGDCEGTDLVADGIVNFEDFAVFAQHWLEQ